jgi:hypothetical protein
MNPARPLLFLTCKTVWNGLKRAFTTPRRLITVIFAVGYYFFIFIRPALGPSGGMPMRGLPQGTPQLDFPPMQVIDALSFAIFCVMSLFLMLGVMSANTAFKPADVDVLFSTPISPKVVLTFRIVRDYLITLLVPLLLAVFGLRPARMGWEAVFRNMPNPEYSGMVLRFMIISWLLMSLCWVMMSYAVSMWLNRNDAGSDRRRRIFGWTMTVFVVGVSAYIAYRFSLVHSTADAMAVAQTPALRVIFFTATFATQMTLAPFTTSGPLSAVVGAGGLIAVIGFAYWLALRQVGWMYDQAAVRAASVSNAVELQRSGDMAGLMALRAREGKFKGLRLQFISRLRMRSWRALIWKELVLQPRTTLGLTVMFTLIGIMMSLIGTLPDKRNSLEPGYLFLMMQGIVVFMITMALAQTGFVEVLRRVDLQKPLPFKSWVTVASEIGSKALVSVGAAVVGALVTLGVKFALWPFILASLVGMPGFGFLLSACVFMVTMLFPDVDDPSQRGIRGIMIMLSIAVCSLFPALAMVGLLAIDVVPVLATGAAGLVASAIGLGLAMVSAQLYDNFNPSE